MEYLFAYLNIQLLQKCLKSHDVNGFFFPCVTLTIKPLGQKTQGCLMCVKKKKKTLNAFVGLPFGRFSHKCQLFRFFVKAKIRFHTGKLFVLSLSLKLTNDN